MTVTVRGLIAVVAVGLCALFSSCGKSPPREYKVLNAEAPDRPADMTLSATLIVEVIDVDSTLFENWISENSIAPDAATPFRKAAQNWINDGKAIVAETVTLCVRDGSTSRIQSQQIEFSTGDGKKLQANKLGSSLEASVTINADSRVCSIQLNPSVLNPDKPKPDSPIENNWDWSGTNLASSVALPEMTYGFLGSRDASESLPQRKASTAKTSLFFLRADTSLPPLSVPPPTSPL